jgi:hypothetical protein
MIGMGMPQEEIATPLRFEVQGCRAAF